MHILKLATLFQKRAEDFESQVGDLIEYLTGTKPAQLAKPKSFFDPLPTEDSKPETSSQVSSHPAQASIDRANAYHISTLDPKVQPLAQQLINLSKEKGIFLIITEGKRSSERQAELYQKGRNAQGEIVDPGAIVTRAKPGTSKHETGLAFDIAFADQNGKPTYKSDKWDEVGSLAESLGLKWGKYFKGLRDLPHFQL